jgi:hypothetical protein
MAQNFRNGYIQTYTAGLEHEFGDLKFSASYVGTAGVKLADLVNVNGYGGAIAGFAPFTRFDATGQAVGGVGPVTLIGCSPLSRRGVFRASCCFLTGFTAFGQFFARDYRQRGVR